MKHHRAAVLFVFLVAGAHAAQDTPSNFGGVCTVNAIRNNSEHDPIRWTTPCRLENLPAPGFHNRWHILLYGDAPDRFWLQPMADWIRADATEDGIVTRSILWGEVKIIATSAAVKSVMSRANYGHEVRPQRMRIQMLEPGVTEIFMWEPAEEWSGPVTNAIAPAWMQDWTRSFLELSDAK